MPAPAYAIDAIQTPLPDKLDTWHVTTAPPLSVTYSFESGPSSQFPGAYQGWSAWTMAQMDAVRAGLREFESVINVRFVELAPGSADPDIVFGRASLSGHAGEAWWNYSYQTDANGEVTSKSFDSAVVFDASSDMTNGGFRYTIVHEIGHAMLMKHPGEYDSTGNHPPPPYLPAGEDNVDFTAMSYNWSAGGGPGFQLELYDIAALQARWGANMTSAADDSIYTFNQDQGIFAIWDTGGYDRIDATYATNRVNIDLNEGAFSKLAAQNRLSIAWGSKIENANGSAFSDTITGNAGDNILQGGAGSDILDGGAGSDTAWYSGVRADYGWAENADGSWTVADTRSSGDGTDTLRNIEFLRFLDGTFDIRSSAPPPTDPNAGRVYNSPGPGSTVTGGAGNDTINASQGPDGLTGGAGADVFAWAKAPWSPAKVMDFEQGADRLDLSALFRASGYTGSDPVGDGYIRFVGVQGGTGVIFDSDGKATGDQWGSYIINVQGVPSTQANWSVLSDGEAAPVFNFATTTLSRAEGSSGTTDFTFTVTRSGGMSAASVSWGLSGTGANPASTEDFAGASAPGRFPAGYLSFAEGETSKTITVAVVGDTAVEADEGFILSLFIANGGAVGAQNRATGLIVNDDSGTTPPPEADGRVINSTGPGSTMIGGAGADTLNAGVGGDTMTGGAGADVFAYADLPWHYGEITDFKVGVDRLDLSGLLADIGYAGADPVADGYVKLLNAHTPGSTYLYIDTDGPAPGDQWGTYVALLRGVSGSPGNVSEKSTLSWADLSNGASPPPPDTEGRVIHSPAPGATLTGGAGDDTLNASRGADVLTGGEGADHFVFAHENWAPAKITDFHSGQDKIDLRGVFDDWGYAGTDPVADGHVILLADAAGTKVLLDDDGPGGEWGNYVLLIEGVQPGGLQAGDWLFQ